MINALSSKELVFASVGTLGPYQPRLICPSSSLDLWLYFFKDFAFLGHLDLEIHLLAFIWVLSFRNFKTVKRKLFIFWSKTMISGKKWLLYSLHLKCLISILFFDPLIPKLFTPQQLKLKKYFNLPF